MLFLVSLLFTVANLPFCEAVNEKTCDENLNGCGPFVDEGGLQNACCSCRECLSVDSIIPVDIHCVIQSENNLSAQCCPCETETSLSGGSTCTAPRLEECAERGDLRRVTRLVNKAERISRRTIRRCGTPVTDDCAGKRVLRRLECIYDEIHCTIQDIKEDCERDH